MKKSQTAPSRKTSYDTLGTSNIYEELSKYQVQRDAATREWVAKLKQLQRVLEAKMAYLSNMQESHGAHYKPGDTSHVFKAVGEDTCVIDDMPGWTLSPDTWLGPYGSKHLPEVYFAIGADGLLYCSRRTSDRDSFMCVEHRLMEYSAEQLAQIADAIEAYASGSASKIIDLMIVRSEWLRATTDSQS